jgi:hypothetical protein
MISLILVEYKNWLGNFVLIGAFQYEELKTNRKTAQLMIEMYKKDKDLLGLERNF